MRCPQCGKANLKEKTGPVEAEYRNETFTVSAPALVCSKCGFYAVDGGDDVTEMMRLLADEYRKKYGLLTSLEIKAFRERRGETQGQFAEYLCVGEASIKRWELGAIQDKAMDELIRLKCDPEKASSNAEAVCGSRTQPNKIILWQVELAKTPRGEFESIASAGNVSIAEASRLRNYSYNA